MPTTAKNIRLECDISSSVSVLDKITGKAPVFFQGASALVQCALFDGAPSSVTYLTDVTGITNLNFMLRKHNTGGAVLVDENITSVASSTYVAWLAGTGQQFSFSLTEDQLSWDVMAAGTLPLYFAVTISTAASTYIACQGYAVLQDVGILNGAPLAVPAGFYDLAPFALGVSNVQSVRGQAVVHVKPSIAVTPYTYTVVLLTANVLKPSLVDMYVEIDEANSSPTIQVRNGTSAGNVLHTAFGDSSNPVNQHVQFRFDGTQWLKWGPEVS